MKKLFGLALIVLLSVSLSSCLLLDIILGLSQFLNDGASGGLTTAIVSVATDPNPVVGDEEENGRTLPPQGQTIEKPAVAPESSNEEASEGSSFMDVLSRPTFTLGPGLSWLGGDKNESEKFPLRPGFQLGVFWQVPLTPQVSLDPGLQYANRGLEYKYEESGMYNYSYGQKKTLHYLELPVLVNGDISDNLSLFGGPQIGFLLGAKVVSDSESGGSVTEKGTSGFKKVDVGLTAGVRYLIPNTAFGISLGYYHGFSNLNANTYGGGYSVPKNNTNAVRVGAYYSY